MLLSRHELIIVVQLNARVVHVAELGCRLHAPQVPRFLVAVEGSDHILVDGVAVFVEMPHEVLSILDVVVATQGESKPVRAVEEVITLVEFALRLHRQFEV